MMLFAPSPMGGLYNGEQLKSHEDDSVMKALRHLMISMLLTLASVGPAAAALPTTLPDGQNLPSLAPMLREVTPAVVNIATFASVQRYNPLLQDPFFRRFFDRSEERRVGKECRSRRAPDDGRNNAEVHSPPLRTAVGLWCLC